MTVLFGRKVRVEVEGANEAIVFSDDFDIQFNVTSTRTSTPDTSTIKIYNLSSTTISNFTEEYKIVNLYAGHEQRFGLIYRGNISEFIFEKAKVDNNITISCKSNNIAKNSKTNLKIPENTALEDAIKMIASDLKTQSGINIGRILTDDTPWGNLDLSSNTQTSSDLNGNVIVPYNKEIKNSMSVVGNTADILDTFAKNYNAQWTINNGVFEWVSNEMSSDAQSAEILSPDTGMIGTPQLNDNGIIVTTLLNPYLRVNNQVIVISDYLERNNVFSGIKVKTLEGGGVYRVNKIRHSGSNFENQFYSMVTCQPISSSNKTSGGENKVIDKKFKKETVLTDSRVIPVDSSLAGEPAFF